MPLFERLARVAGMATLFLLSFASPPFFAAAQEEFFFCQKVRGGSVSVLFVDRAPSLIRRLPRRHRCRSPRERKESRGETVFSVSRESVLLPISERITLLIHFFN